MKSALKKILTSKFPGLYFFIEKFHKTNISEEKKIEYTISEYYRRFGRKLDLEHPQTFYEKVNFLRLFYFDENASKFVDKIAVKKIVESNGYSNHFAKILNVSKNLNELKKYITQNAEKKFVIKFSHIGGAFFWNNNIIKDKNGSFVSKKFLFAAIKHYLKCDYYKENFEWTYNGIKSFVFVEEFLPSMNDNGLQEYKFFCNYGDIKMINVVSGRQDHKNLKEAFTDENLHLFNVHQSVKSYRQDEILVPEKFEEMKTFASKLTKQFPIVRVDLIVNKNNWYLCEFTFFDCGGFNIFEPESSNIEIGNLFDISRICK